MLLNAWIYGYPWSLDRESWFCHPFREGLTQCLKGCLGQSIVHISVAACDRLLLLCDGKPQLRHVLRLLKNDINK